MGGSKTSEQTILIRPFGDKTKLSPVSTTRAEPEFKPVTAGVENVENNILGLFRTSSKLFFFL